MMTFKTDDGRMIRCRQRRLTGPVTVELMTPVRMESGETGYYTSEKTVKVNPADLMDFFMDRLGISE